MVASAADSVVDLEGVATEVEEASVVVIAVDTVEAVEVLVIKVEEALAEEEVGMEVVVPPTATVHHPQMHLLVLAAVAASVVGMGALPVVA